jgi:hypothetical protein
LWSGLVLAAGFAVLIDWLLAASFVWVELLSPMDLRLGWMAAGSLWGTAAILSAGFGRATPGASSRDPVFRGALKDYLQGNWFEAESALGRLLRRAPRDVEGRLLLATLLRRNRRYDEALDQLDRLERLRDAARWAREIAQERQRIAEHIAAQAAEAIPVDATADALATKQAA